MMLSVHLQFTWTHITEMNAELLTRLVAGRKRDGRCKYSYDTNLSLNKPLRINGPFSDCVLESIDPIAVA